MITSAIVVGASFVCATAAAERPNFVFIYTDDQRWDALGVVQREQGAKARFPWLRTPNLDRLASEGVRFRNAFVVNSLCSPSRACFLTGRYSHFNGIANNHTPFDPQTVTHASLLRAAGYRTGYVGKWHMGPQTGQRPGFDYSASFVGQGRYFDCPFEINGKTAPTKGWVDDVSTDYALGFIKDHQREPFLLVLGFKSSHGPWESPARLQNLYANDVSQPPANASARPPYVKSQPAERKNVNQFTNNANADANRARMQRNYFRTLSGVDENVGRVLRALDDLKLTENTVVVFASDNGFYLGEHGLGDKRSAYEESLRIPLLARYPKLIRQAKTDDHMVLNIDLAPTFLELAGVAIPKEMQGRSWAPLLTGKPIEWRKSWFYEYFLEANMGPPSMLAVRTRTAKIIKYPGHEDWTEVFDLEADPYETKNLADDPARADLRRYLEDEFQRQSAAVEFRVPAYADKPGAAARPLAARLNRNVLTYDFKNWDGDGKPTRDESGSGNDGAAVGVKRAADQGRSVARFESGARIEVAKAPTLNCANGPWSFRASFKSERPTGVIMARGGQTQGYAIHLKDGKPVVSARVGGQAFQVAAARAVVGEWTEATGVISADRSLRLYLNGKLAGSTPLPSFIASDPNDVMQIGDDRGSQVANYDGASGFVGWMRSVSIFSGELDPSSTQEPSR